MILSRAKPANVSQTAPTVAQVKEKAKVPEIDELLEKRDYTAAIALLEFQRDADKSDKKKDLWIAYCSFHVGDYKKSMEEYEKIVQSGSSSPDIYIYLACCQFYLGMYSEANETALKGPQSPLQNRLLFHVSHKLNDEKRLMKHHQQLQDVLEDQLCLASIHYLRSHYQEAIDIYKRVLLSNRNFVALNVYLALCYYKLDYYDVSLEVLQIYLQPYPDSAIALNLKACNHFKLYNGKAAEAELKILQNAASSSFSFAREVIRHNLVVFRNGEGALQVLPPLVDVISEARLNLVIYYLRRDEIQEAFNLIKDLDPSVPQEYILKGIVHCLLGQQNNAKEHLKIAQQYFQLVGGSAAECDTIPGRQCMASCYFLLKQFEEVLIYLNSVKSYFFNDDAFNYNFAQAQASLGHYKEAEDALLLIQSEKIKRDFTFLVTLARCYIMNKKARLAWELYVKIDTSDSESFTLLQLIANDCYRMGQFYYAAKAFDVLERLDPNPEHWDGKRGACVGVFQLILAGKEPPESIRDVLQILQSSIQPQVDQISRLIRKWAQDNQVHF